MKRQKNFSILLLLITVISVTELPKPGLAQEQDGCFMQSASGRVIKLNSLCNSTPQPTPPASNGAASATPGGVFQVPIKRRVSGIPVIEVTFNGNQKFEMLVDTGASGTVITPTMAQALRIVPHTTVLVNTPSNSSIPFPVGRVNSIEAGGIIISNTEVAIAGPELPVGLLGQNFFGNYDVTIKQNVIEFRSRS